MLLEEFTAIHCGNCPAGHDLAASLVAAHPGAVIPVELAGGSLAVPQAGQPDLRTPASLALWSFYSVASQPRALVDRRPYNGQPTLSTGSWTPAVNAALQLASPVNVGLSSQYDAGTQTLHIDVEAYYTADSPGENDRIEVLVKEDHIIGYQEDYVNGAHASYDHVNVLRAYVTDLWGDEVSTTTAGSLVQRSYSIEVPAGWNVANCKVVAFVSEYQGEVYQAREVAAADGATAIAEDVDAPAPTAFPCPASTTISLPTEQVTPTFVTLLDQAGRTVAAQLVTPSNGLLNIDVTALQTGVYIVRAGDRNARFVVAR